MKKNLPYVLLLLLTVVFLLYVSLINTSETVNIPMLFLTIFVLNLMLIYCLIRIVYQSSLNQQENMDILLQQCDPNRLLEILRNQIKKGKPLALLNASLCYIALGNYSSAMSLAASISPASRKRSPGWDFLCHDRFFNCYLMQNNLEAARHELDAMRAILLAKHAPFSTLQIYKIIYLQNYYDFSIKIDNFDGSLQFYNALLSIDKYLLSKIEVQYNIACVYVSLGNPAAAREAANFVIENGNKTVYVSLAQKLLAEIEHKNI